MAIICGPVTETISFVSKSICGHLIKIYDIEPMYDTIKILLNNQQIIPGIGHVNVRIDSQRVDIRLISKNATAGTAVIAFTLESIEVPPPPVIEPTHVIKFELAPYPYLSYLQQNIVSISAQVASALPFTPNVQYIKTELDPTGKYINVYVRHIGVALSYMSMDYNDYRSIYSLGIIDDINNFAKTLIPILVTIASALIVAAIILAGGFTLPVIVTALAAGGLVFILGFFTYDLVTRLEIAVEVINNQQAFIQPTIEKDTGKKVLDDAFEKSTKTKEDCLTLLRGYQEKDRIYINSMSSKLTKLELTGLKSAYDICTNRLIESFDAGTIACDYARANFTVCENALYAGTGEEFNINYDPNEEFKEECPKDCFICEPITGKCLVSNTTLMLLGLGVIGFMYLSTRPKETIVIKGG